jgi:lipoate-protein ligase B
MLRRRHLGRVSFAEANDLQRALMQAKDDYVLLFEHPATYTRGIRTLDEHFLVAPESLDAVVIDADRGGDVTYHAPGQVVAWAIVTVEDDPSAGRAHVTRLEAAVIATVRHFDPDGELGVVGRLEGYPGVWADLEGVPSKIAAVGVRTERNEAGARRTLHGVALNVDIDMDGFKVIVPCGIADRPVASLRTLGLEVSSLEVEERLGFELETRLAGVSHDEFGAPDAPSAAQGRRRSRRRYPDSLAQARVVAHRGPHGQRVPVTADPDGGPAPRHGL